MRQYSFTKGSIGNVLLIILGIILAAVLVGLVTGNNRLLGEFTKKSPIVKTDTEKEKIGCGLTVTNPDENELVAFPLKVTGYVNGCGWVAQENLAGVVTMIDANNTIQSTEALIVDGDWMKPPVAFHVTLSAPMPTNTGTLKFINLDPSGENPKEHIVHFKY